MSQNNGNNSIPFTRRNYVIMLIGFAVILLGYFIMSTEDFVDATKFSLALHVCPFIIVAGLVIVGYGIMARSSAAQPVKHDSPQ